MADQENTLNVWPKRKRLLVRWEAEKIDLSAPEAVSQAICDFQRLLNSDEGFEFTVEEEGRSWCFRGYRTKSGRLVVLHVPKGG